MPFGPGQGFFLQNASGVGATLAFYGEVAVGSVIVPVPDGRSLLSSKVPQAGALESELGFPAEYDTVHKWNSGLGEFGAYVHEVGYGWPFGQPGLGVGEAFWLETGSARNWTRNFSPNVALQLAGPSTYGDAAAAFPVFNAASGSPVQ